VFKDDPTFTTFGDLGAFGIWNNGKTPTCEQKPTSHTIE